MQRALEMLPADDHNHALVELVHPPAWANPTPADRYNLVVIGAGTAGLVTAAGAAGLGAKVALLERALMGGDCLNFGCVPSKGIIGAARMLSEARRATELGIGAGGVHPDFGQVMERMRRIRSGIARHDSAARFQAMGVDVFLGDATFQNRQTVIVGDSKLRFAKAVIATGARAFVPQVEGLEGIPYLTNETIFSLTELPPRLLVMGGGPIGCELAQCFQRLGSAVTQVEMSSHILPRADADAAEVVREAMARDGVRLLLGAHVKRVERVGGAIRAHIAHGEAVEDVETDALLLAVGRAPNVEGLNLDAVGVEYDPRRGIAVDDTLRTTNAAIYACGDVCQAYQFTHAADAAARIVIRNALFPFLPKARFGRLVIPWCTYTDPEIAHVGLSEQEASRQGIPIDTFTIPMESVDRAILDGDTAGLLKIHVAKGKDGILGATLVSAHAGESIGILTSAITHGLGLGKLGSVIFPYPTQAEVIKKGADAYARSRLTPTVARLFRRILAWQR